MRPFASALTHLWKLRTEAFRNPAFPALSDRRFPSFMYTSGSGVSGSESRPMYDSDIGRIMDEIGDNLRAFLACLDESLWITCGQHFEAGRWRGGDDGMMRRRFAASRMQGAPSRERSRGGESGHSTCLQEVVGIPFGIFPGFTCNSSRFPKFGYAAVAWQDSFRDILERAR